MNSACALSAILQGVQDLRRPQRFNGWNTGKAWKIRKITWGRHSGALLPLVKSAAFLQLQLERMRTMHNMYQYATPCHGPKTSKTHLWLRVLLFFSYDFPMFSLFFPYYSISLWFPYFCPKFSQFVPYYFPIVSLLFPYFLICSLFFPHVSLFALSLCFFYYFPIMSVLCPNYSMYLFPMCSLLCPYWFPII